jgi:transposase InsO family protein
MLDAHQFGDWCRQLGLSSQTERMIQQIRASPPARHVRSGRGNVSGRYPSRKMGVTIQFESHRNELAAIYAMEHSRAVVEYWDQPPPIKLAYRTRVGRAIGVLHTPDFFVLRTDSAGWEEWKLEDDLRRLAERQPQRYCRTAEDTWRCPPGEAYAQAFGLSYQLRSSAEINWVFQRNMLFLEDYLRAEPAPSPPAVAETIQRMVAAQPGMTLQELLHHDISLADAIYFWIATEHVYVALDAVPLAEPARVPLFPDRDTALAYAHVHETVAGSSVPGIPLACGVAVQWDGRAWTIGHVGETTVGLRGEGSAWTEVPLQVFEMLVRQGKLTGLAPAPTQAQITVTERLRSAGPAEVREANRRYELIRPFLQEATVTPPGRTAYRWLARYRQAERLYGTGYVGLLPRTRHRGNRQAKLPEATRALMLHHIVQEYETPTQKNKQSVYAALLHACAERGVLAPSYKTFVRAVNTRSRYDQTRKRQGARAAYVHEPFYATLDLTTPRHGDRPFEIVHLDHTELDIELVCSRTGRPLGRPWASFLTDAFSRRVLAVVLLYQPPSKVACMLTIRECVRRFGRLPQTLVVDGGREFQSTYFETLLAVYECVKKTRPPAKARFGSVCERLFGTANTQFVHNLQGNTQSTRQVRQMTAAVNPRTHAIWTLEALAQRVREFAYEVYDTAPHTALGLSPREVFTQGMATSGARTHRLIPYDEHFRMLTLPTTYKETATVSPGKGIRLHYLYYWADAFRDPFVERTRVPVRYEPHDVGIAYAFVHHHWVRCTSEHYRIFRGHSTEEVQLAAAELQQRRRKLAQESAITARRLATFLTSVEAEERLLAQRLRDAAVKQSLEGITWEEADVVRIPRTPCTSPDQAVALASAADETIVAASTVSDERYLLPEY